MLFQDQQDMEHVCLGKIMVTHVWCSLFMLMWMVIVWVLDKRFKKNLVNSAPKRPCRLTNPNGWITFRLVKQHQSYYAWEKNYHHWPERSHTQDQFLFLTSENLKFAFILLVYFSLYLSPDLHNFLFFLMN